LVRSKQNHVGLWDHLFGKDPKEEVTIKAPRQIALSFRGINGRVNTTDIDGSLEVRGVNGRLDFGQVNDFAEINGVNGDISVGLNKLGSRGVRASGVNADLNARGMNGNVRSDISDVTVDRSDFGSRYSARIGSGGSPIDISGINGNVRLTRGPSSAATSNDVKTEKKETAVNKSAQ